MCLRIGLKFSCDCLGTKTFPGLLSFCPQWSAIGLMDFTEEELERIGHVSECFGDYWDEPAFFSLKRPCLDCFKAAWPHSGGANLDDVDRVHQHLYAHAIRRGLEINELIPLLGWDSQDLSPEDLEWVQSLLESIRAIVLTIETKVTNPATPASSRTIETLSLLEAQLHSAEKENIVQSGLREMGLITDTLPPLFEPVPLSTLEEKECPTCSLSYGEKDENGLIEEPVKSPCNHVMGSSCFRHWVVQNGHANCPLCRAGFSERTHKFPVRTPAWLALIRGF